MYKLEFLDKEYKVETFKAAYNENDNLAVIVQNKNFEEVLTVNLKDNPTNENCAFIDTNNVRWAEKFLQENQIAQPTGRYAISGFCSYPEYRFDMSKLKDYEAENDKRNKKMKDKERNSKRKNNDMEL